MLREELRAGGAGRGTAPLSAGEKSTAPLSACWYPHLRSILQNSSILSLGFPCGSAGKESACNVGDLGSIPGLGRSPGEGKGCPLQCSGLESSIIHGVTKSRTRLSNFHYVLWGPLPLQSDFLNRLVKFCNSSCWILIVTSLKLSVSLVELSSYQYWVFQLMSMMCVYLSVCVHMLVHLHWNISC